MTPNPKDLNLTTTRLHLEPITAHHAPAMVTLLSDPELYRFVPSAPPSLSELTTQYRRWEARSSPSGDEVWLNWAVRELKSGLLIGHVQAGLDQALDATIAYTIGTAHQRRGYALEAVRAMCNLLRETFDAKRVRAWIDTRNASSIALVQKLGMVEVERIKDADFFKGASSDDVVFELPADWQP